MLCAWEGPRCLLATKDSPAAKPSSREVVPLSNCGSPRLNVQASLHRTCPIQAESASFPCILESALRTPQFLPPKSGLHETCGVRVRRGTISRKPIVEPIAMDPWRTPHNNVAHPAAAFLEQIGLIASGSDNRGLIGRRRNEPSSTGSAITGS